ncbi:MAG: hypothetical protein IH611_00995 [Deltaproteobacteria bacterium]|nr:hypothetical protein [Deltaproteobacteria bacterium]
MRHDLFAIVALGLSLALIGCGSRKEGEPTGHRSQAGLEEPTRKAAGQSLNRIEGRGNRRFAAATDIRPGRATARDLDGILRPVLIRQFHEAKLIAAQGPEAPRKDGEVVEDRLLYAVREPLTGSAGDALHQALRDAGFAASPRLGKKPARSRGRVFMSVMRTTPRRGYSLVIIVDTDKQEIEVESYKLGSRYDRLT